MTEPSTADAERLYGFLADYISAHGYPPGSREIQRFTHQNKHTRELLGVLERQGRIRVLPWKGRSGWAIALVQSSQSQSPNIDRSRAAPILARSSPVTVESAIDWKRMLKDFRGVAISRITAGQIGRYYRKRCQEKDPQQAEREANVLLCLRFPEVFLERRHKLALEGFDDRQRPKRGCRSCGAKFRKIKPNQLQLYCSARCRAREKRHRRQETAHGKLLRRQQNQRYRLRHENRERERRRQWRLNHPREYRAQKERELTRRSLRPRDLPMAVASVIATHPDNRR